MSAQFKTMVAIGFKCSANHLLCVCKVTHIFIFHGKHLGIFAARRWAKPYAHGGLCSLETQTYPKTINSLDEVPGFHGAFRQRPRAPPWANFRAICCKNASRKNRGCDDFEG